MIVHCRVSFTLSRVSPDRMIPLVLRISPSPRRTIVRRYSPADENTRTSSAWLSATYMVPSLAA